MASGDVQLFEYRGPRHLVVALGVEVEDGSQVYGPASLENTAGFTKIAASKASDSKLVNEREEAKDAVDAGAHLGSGEQTEEDH